MQHSITPQSIAEGAGRGDIRGVQLAGSCKHVTADVGVSEDGVEKAREAADRSVGAVGGGDIRGVQLAGSCKHAVGVCDDGNATRGGLVGQASGTDEGACARVQLAGRQEVANTLWATCFLSINNPDVTWRFPEHFVARCGFLMCLALKSNICFIGTSYLLHQLSLVTCKVV